ncbi:MAG TPA: hypothetical protein VLQ79_02550 [Myxococcaceae bacterium]|nr:hypothetical protein [Myxococcaceae bacterium]
MPHRTRTRLVRGWACSVLLCATLSAPAGASSGPEAGSAVPAAPAAICGGDPACTEVNAFAMTVVDLRASLQGYWKVLTVTLRFRNKVDRPVVLGYVQGSGGATDDKGNRYLVKDSDVRGIGFIAARPDDKFQIAPGQTGDARFTLVWNGQQLFGNTFDLDLTVREILPAGNGQTTLGAEYPLQISGLADRARAAPAVATASGAAPVGQASPPAMDTPPIPIAPGTTTVAHCAPGSSCQDVGAFSATVIGTATAVSGKNQLVRLSVSLKNHTAQPLVLAYKAGTAGALDEQGSAFTFGRPGGPDTSAQGIGTVEPGRIDARFRLAPGASADAQFVLTRFDAGPKPPGRSFTLNTVLVELRPIAGGQQWQVAREYALRLPAQGPGATPAAGSVPALLKGLLGGQ